MQGTPRTSVDTRRTAPPEALVPRARRAGVVLLALPLGLRDGPAVTRPRDMEGWEVRGPAFSFWFAARTRRLLPALSTLGEIPAETPWWIHNAHTGVPPLDLPVDPTAPGRVASASGSDVMTTILKKLREEIPTTERRTPGTIFYGS
jgi:hypothetical protein